MSLKKKAIVASLITKNAPKNTMNTTTTKLLCNTSSCFGQRIRLISVNIPERLNHFNIFSPPTSFLCVKFAYYNAYKISLILIALSHWLYYVKWCNYEINTQCTLKWHALFCLPYHHSISCFITLSQALLSVKHHSYFLLNFLYDIIHIFLSNS